MSETLEVGQVWTPTRTGSGQREIVEMGEAGTPYRTIRYRLRSGKTYRQWSWAFEDWVRRFDCSRTGEADE